MKKCPFCLQEIQDEAVKCKHCGESLGKKYEKPGEGSKFGCLSIFIVLAVILFILIVIGTCSHSNYTSISSGGYPPTGYSDAQKKDIEKISRRTGESVSRIESSIEAVSKSSSVVTKQDLIDASKAFYGVDDEK